jgi:PDZ domain-containing protein
VTLLVGGLVVLVTAVLGLVLPVPFVALGPGPTYNTLGEVDGTPVVSVDGAQTYPTAGNLNMTTVSVRSGLTLFGAVGLWVSGRDAVVPREEVFPPQKSEEQVTQENTQAFAASESSAEVAALRYLGYPTVVRVSSVTDGSPVSGVLAPGDDLLAVDGTPVRAAADVAGAIAGKAPGTVVTLTFRHDGAETTAPVTLGARPDDASRGYLGTGTSDAPDVPFTVDIRLQDVGGPSAGLMFSLAVVDELTPGELNGGAFVAGTGTIDDSGAVGPIGGIPFKLIAAREAGATTFLVPADNCAEALSRAPDGLRLVKVDSLTSAVTALQTLDAGGTPPGC